MSKLFTRVQLSRCAVLLSFLASSCNLINPEESTPSFIEVNVATLKTTVSQGSASHKIKDVWVYVDGSFLGAFELPTKFPVLEEGKHVISFGAGILKNGIASTRTTYPFYRFITDTLDLKAGEVIEIDTLKYEYFPSLYFPWIEDFEGGSLSMDTLSTSLAHLVVDTVNAYEGKKCVRMQVQTLDSIIAVAGNTYYAIPTGRDVYLEMNYKCDQPFLVGLQSVKSTGTTTTVIEQLNASTDWNKIYIDLSGTINFNGDASGHRVYFYSKLAAGATQGNIYLDNIKIVHN